MGCEKGRAAVRLELLAKKEYSSVTGIQLRSPKSQQITLRYFKDAIIVRCPLVTQYTRKTLKILLIVIYKITSITRKFSSTTREEIDI